MAVTYPTLSRYPIPGSFRETLAYDPSIRTQAESGKVVSRARFTSTKKRFEFAYSYLTDADMTLLDTLEDDAMVGAELITWTHPKSSAVYSVRLAEPIRRNVMDADTTEWEASLILIED